MRRVSQIHGLTSHGRILRRAERYLRCLQEELSEINASVFSTCLIELSSIKALKLSLSTPVSPLFSRLVRHFYSRFRFFWKAPIHRSLTSRFSLPLTRCPHRCWTTLLPTKSSVFAAQTWPSVTFSCPRVLQWCFAPSKIRFPCNTWSPVKKKKRKERGGNSEPSLLFLAGGRLTAFGFPECVTQINGWTCSESRLANTSSWSGKTATVADSSLTTSRFMARCWHSKEARLLLLPWLLLMAGGWLAAAVAKHRKAFTHSVPAETASHQFVPIVAV